LRLEVPLDLRPRLEAGRAAFNAGAYFEAHELWEEVWRELCGDRCVLVQGLIQIAAGFHHQQQGRRRPAVRLLEKGLTKVSAGASLFTIDLGAFITGVSRIIHQLHASTEGTPELRGVQL
jgi:hypothetical protein